MRTLSPETQTLCSELMEQLIALEARRSIGHLKGCFTAKTVKGEVYYYFQHIDPNGTQRQIYMGRKTPALEKLIAKFEVEKELFKPDADHIKRLCAQVRAGGAMSTDAASSRVIKALADSGVFQLQGVLIGTHAFTVIGNMLGVNWETHVKTHDIDIASYKNIAVAVPDLKADIPDTLLKLQMGFLPVPAFNSKNPSTLFKVRGQTLILDVLTPVVKKDDTTPVFIERLNAAALPLPFLDYLIENPEKGTVINNEGVLVNVPSPARFAFHKLIVSQERSATMHTKVAKDINQAASLFNILCDERQGDISLAWETLQKRGQGWISRVKQSLKLLNKQNPEAYHKLAGTIHIIKKE